MGVLTVDMIQREVANYFHVKLKDLVGPKRHRAVAHPRMVSMYLARKLTRMSFPEIGARYGGKDHSTVISAVRKIERLCVQDATIRAEVEAIERRLCPPTIEVKIEDAVLVTVCPERADGGPHEYTADLEYDSTGQTINCEHCGEEPPIKGGSHGTG